jgi:DNA-binding LacI/PurR family transcriptional regulator
MAARPTVVDVARAAGVSPTVVSHALNDKGRVDPDTRARVRAVATELGYVPSRAARNLALGRSDTIGLLLPTIARLSLSDLLVSDWYGRMAVVASQAAIERRQALMVLPSIGSVADVARFGLEGAIVLDPIGDDPRCATLDAAGVDYVMLGRDPQRPHVPSVAPDTVAAMLELLRHLDDAGARDVAVLATDLAWSAGDEALEAYEAWCAQHAAAPRVIPVPVAQAASRDAIIRATFDITHELLAPANRPHAIIGLFEDFGPAILDAARARHVDVPQQLLVAQDVDGLKAQLMHPSLTAIDLHPNEQVTEAVRLLLDDDRPEPHALTTPTTLRVRDSTSPRHVGSAAAAQRR